MEDKAHNCEFSTAIVDYLYGETSETSHAIFEEHLVSCMTCTDEFAEVADSRFAVYEWQRDEFAPLATPSFVIPYEESRPGILAGLREILSRGWAAPAFAFAAIAVVAGLAFVFVDRGGSNPTVGSVETPPQITTPVIISEEPLQSSAVPETDKDTVTASRPPVSRKPIPRPVRAVNVERRVVPQVPQRTVQARVTTRQAPMLSSEVQADDDTSLRLSDLFDSEGT